MKMIFGLSDPLKVCGRVVGDLTVDMIYLCLAMRIWAESRCDDAVNAMILRDSILVQHDIDVRQASSLRSLADNFGVPKSAHPAEVADFVQPLVANNRSPFFTIKRWRCKPLSAGSRLFASVAVSPNPRVIRVVVRSLRGVEDRLVLHRKLIPFGDTRAAATTARPHFTMIGAM